MGCEFAQEKEWSEPAGSLDWHLLDEADHHGVLDLIRDLNRVYDEEPALWELDHSHEGFRWLEPNAANENVLAFARASENGTAGSCASATSRRSFAKAGASGCRWEASGARR
jgi:1,4-alpha-glucan branching enzyme